MKTSHKLTLLITIIFSCLVLCKVVHAQHATYDKYYWQQSRLIDSLTGYKLLHSIEKTAAIRNIQKAVSINLELSKKYPIEDYTGFFYYSIAAQNPEAFYISCKGLIQLTADSVKDIIDGYANLWEGNDLSVLEKEPLLSAIKKLKAEEPELVTNARLHIDWKWGERLKALSKANIDIRYAPLEHFIDKEHWGQYILYYDSLHFEELYRLIQQYGFPFRSKVGINAAFIRAPLKHFTELVYFEDNPEKSRYFTEKWKKLIPDIYYATKTGQFDCGFYNRLVKEWIPEYLKKGNRKDDLEFFEKYELEMN